MFNNLLFESSFSICAWERLHAVGMMSVMSSTNVGLVVPSPEKGSSAIGEEKIAASTSESRVAGGFGFGAAASSDEAARVGVDVSEETRIFGNESDSRVMKQENTETRFCGSLGAENQPSPSASRLPCSAEGYFVADVGDPEPGVYSLGQIRRAQDNFQPRTWFLSCTM